MKQVWVKSAICAVTRVDDPLVAVADRGHGDAGAEVDELVAVDVATMPPAASLDVDRQADADAGGDRGGLARLEGLRLRGRGWTVARIRFCSIMGRSYPHPKGGVTTDSVGS